MFFSITYFVALLCTILFLVYFVVTDIVDRIRDRKYEE